MTSADAGPLRGRVAEFDVEVGLGVVETSRGDRFMFHCVEIADGTRQIPVGTKVGFEPLAKLGRWEAANLRP